jgi:hypothetical protein
MTLKQNSDQLKWQLRHPRTGRKETQTFRFSQVQRVIIRSEEYEHNAFSSVTVSSWEVYFEVEGHEQEFIVHHEIDVYQALRKAVRLARALRVPLKIADSYGVGTFAESPMPVINLQYSNWEESYTQDGVDIIKNIKTINRTKLTKAVLEQAGSFLFLAITIGVMERWGSFLVWLIGPRLGLVDSTTLYIDLSFWGIVGFFTPDFGLESLIIITAMLSAIIYSIWQNSLNQVIAVDSQSLTYQRGNKFQVDLTRNSLKHVLIIYADHPLLLLVSSKKMLVIDRVGDEEEIEELYSKLTKALKF